ncbi:MAG: aspartate aminotransferase family protein [Pseudomonadales bacterium]|nr:aspartate aminotransferase family protein [Pseudomonadales bacterium]
MNTPMNLDLDAWWMPFTANREFKKHPRIIQRAEGAYFQDADGRRVFDGLSGLWTCGAGHNRAEINRAVLDQLQTLDYSPPFQFGHPGAFELARRVADLMPPGLDRIFFTNSGSEAVETALKMARAYWRLKGKASKTLLVGRDKGYHGVNFGGTHVGGIGPNRLMFGDGPSTDHLGHTLLPGNAFSRGQPAAGAALAEQLETIVARHDASTIAAVIVEPVAGSAGVIPPPVGYLDRLRALCDKHDILLIFDEVITGLGRMGAVTGSAAFGVRPDLITLAKQLTNGVIPMGAVAVRRDIHDTFMQQDTPEYLLEFPHGYTYSGHPVACAAAHASLDILEKDGLIQRVAAMAPVFEDAIHSLKGEPHVLDIRNYGFAGALTLEPYPGEPARRPHEVAMRCWQRGFYVRYGGDTIQLGLPFITETEEINRLIDALRESLRAG